MEDVLQWAGKPPLLSEQRFANLGERIIQAARIAVAEHLRQQGQLAYQPNDQTPLVIGGADHASGDFYSEQFGNDDREAA